MRNFSKLDNFKTLLEKDPKLKTKESKIYLKFYRLISLFSS